MNCNCILRTASAVRFIYLLKLHHINKKAPSEKGALTVPARSQVIVVEMTGFEPATSASRTQRSTKLSHISVKISLHLAMEAVWLGWKDLNPRNGGVRIHCLTAWLHPNDLTKTIIAYYSAFVKRFLKNF